MRLKILLIALLGAATVALATTVNISPNMGMPVPIVGSTPGPEWANDINASLSIIDSHDHSAGKGVPVTPAGLNINADLPFNVHNATSLRSTSFTSQASPLSGGTDPGALYESGADLYYNDGNGNQVRITQSGSVTGSTGTITGLPSGTASAAYSAGTFTFQSATSTPATISAGPIFISRNVASPFGVTLSASGSQGSNYAMTLPSSLPGSTAIMSLDSSGNVASTTTPNITGGTITGIFSGSPEWNAGGVAATQLTALNAGAISSPGIGFASENSGLYLVGTHELGVAVNSTLVLDMTATNVEAPSLTLTGTGGNTPHACVVQHNNCIGPVSICTLTCDAGKALAGAGICQAGAGTVTQSFASTTQWQCNSTSSTFWQTSAICCSL